MRKQVSPVEVVRLHVKPASSSSAGAPSTLPSRNAAPSPSSRSGGSGTPGVLLLARLLAQAPLRLVGGVYYPSLLWRVYAFPIHIAYNVAIAVTVYGMMFSEQFSQSEMPDFIRLKIHVTGIVTMISSAAFSWFCVTRQHNELHLILNKIKAQRSVRDLLLLLLNLLSFVGLFGSYINMVDYMSQSYAAAMIQWAFFSSTVLPIMQGTFRSLIKSVRSEYKSVNEKVEAMLMAKRKLSWDTVDMADEMFVLHSLHEETTKTLRDICHCFGPQLSVMLLWCLVFSVVDLHHALPAIFARPPTLNVSHVSTAINILQIVAVTVPFVLCCHEAAEEGNHTQLLLQGFFDIKNLTARELREVKRFLPILQEDRVQVHLIGIITADNSLLISIVSTIVTYLIIVLQFKSSGS